MYKKTLAVLIISTGFVIGCRDDHRNSEFSLTRDKKKICANQIHSVPDAGGTLGFLTMGVSLVGFTYWRMRNLK